jgi:hypothetical protein
MTASLFEPVPATPADANGFVLCEFAGTTLAVPQTDVVTIEQGSELSAALPGEAALGWFASAQGPWPAYALDRELRLHTQLPDARTFLLFVRNEPWPLGLLCESVRIVRTREALSTLPLPNVMRDESGLIESVARLAKGQLALICRSGGLADFLSNHLLELAA